MSVVIGSVAQLMTKYLSIDIVSTPTWNSMILISEETKKRKTKKNNKKKQISFWKASLHMLNKRKMKIKPSSNLVVYTDVSDTGHGGYCVRTGQNISHGLWEESERIMSSTWRYSPQ